MADLDFAKRARAGDPLTSHLAAEQASAFAAAHQAKILGALLTQGPGTIYDIAERTGLDSVAVARRMAELEALKTARPTGLTKAGPTGRQCRVWAAT